MAWQQAGNHPAYTQTQMRPRCPKHDSGVARGAPACMLCDVLLPETVRWTIWGVAPENLPDVDGGRLKLQNKLSRVLRAWS
jgi:hypothetical protein